MIISQSENDKKIIVDIDRYQYTKFQLRNEQRESFSESVLVARFICRIYFLFRDVSQLLNSL